MCWETRRHQISRSGPTCNEEEKAFKFNHECYGRDAGWGWSHVTSTSERLFHVRTYRNSSILYTGTSTNIVAACWYFHNLLAVDSIIHRHLLSISGIDSGLGSAYLFGFGMIISSGSTKAPKSYLDWENIVYSVFTKNQIRFLLETIKLSLYPDHKIKLLKKDQRKVDCSLSKPLSTTYLQKGEHCCDYLMDAFLWSRCAQVLCNTIERFIAVNRGEIA